jgi:predicted phosphodiesterase
LQATYIYRRIDAMRIIDFGDTHFPCVRPGALEFVRDIQAQYKCDTVVHHGDVFDEHAVSPTHTPEPDAPGPRAEYDESFAIVQDWKKAFPNMRVCWGNHDLRSFRAASAARIIEKRLKPFAELWDTPGWKWDFEWILDGILFTHMTNNGGLTPAFNAMRARAMSVVLGHHHTCSGKKTMVNPDRRLFGVDAGALCDDRTIQFRYARVIPARSVMSAVTIIDGYPEVHEMPIGRGEKYHDSRFKRRFKCNP